MDISPYFKLMLEKNASDLFLTTNSTVKIKIEGRLQSVGKTMLTGGQLKAFAYDIMTPQQRALFEENMECDFAIPFEDKARFRANVFRQRGEISLVFRCIPNKIPTIKQLGVPEVLKGLIMNKNGCVLVVGATGSGKSTTLAAMINHRNETVADHILTIEDPVEFNHPNLKSIINQREIGVDTLSYSNALKSSLREVPDVVMIGEIRDRETMESALKLSNVGSLTISTLHANNTNQAMERIVNMFPQDMHKQLFMDLSLNIRAVISQRLVVGVDGKRCAATEVMVNTPHIAELILRGDIGEIKVAMAESKQKNIQTFDLALYNLYKEGRIKLEEALNNADSRANLEAKINFG